MSDEPFSPKPRKKRPARETGRNGTEASGKAWVKARGGVSRKWVSPGHNGVPDQIELYGVDEMMLWMTLNWHELQAAHFNDEKEFRALCVQMLACAIQFTEYKAPGKAHTVTANQASSHRELRDRGFTVHVVDFFRSKQP